MHMCTPLLFSLFSLSFLLFSSLSPLWPLPSVLSSVLSQSNILSYAGHGKSDHGEFSKDAIFAQRGLRYYSQVISVKLSI